MKERSSNKEFLVLEERLNDNFVDNSRIRDIRSKNPNDIKDAKERNRLIKAKQQVALKPKEYKRTTKQEESVEQFYKDAQIERK